MLRGSIGNHTLSVEFKAELKTDDGEELVGLCVHSAQTGHVAVSIDPECREIGLADTLVHELCHGAAYVHGFDVPHSTIYTIAVALTQALITTGLVDVQAFEVRMRRLMLESEEKISPLDVKADV